jgi:hypothetical protein
LLTVGAVEVDEERVTAPVAIGKDESGWTRWLWLLLLLLLLGSRWQSKRVLQRREREVVRPPCEVVKRLLVVEVVVEKMLVRVVVAAVGCRIAKSERERERQRRWQKPGRG